MARIARVIAPGFPHHVTQRGNRRQETFFCDKDYEAYLSLMAEWCRKCRVEILAWCLMPNHVHLIPVLESEDGLARAIGEAHRRYTRMKNFAEGVRGYLFQGRFGSCVLDQQHLLAAGRYVERNPVNARLVKRGAGSGDRDLGTVYSIDINSPSAILGQFREGSSGDRGAVPGTVY